MSARVGTLDCRFPGFDERGQTLSLLVEHILAALNVVIAGRGWSDTHHGFMRAVAKQLLLAP
jgi:hypothetical protein